MFKVAIEYDLGFSRESGCPPLKGIEFQWLSRVPSEGEFIKVHLTDGEANPDHDDVVLVYPVKRVTHYAFKSPPEKGVPVAVVRLGL